MSLSLHEQLKLHMENREENNKIWPHDCWTIEEYKEFFRYVDDGWLIQSDYYSGHNAFVIDEEYEGDPPPCREDGFYTNAKCVCEKKKNNNYACLCDSTDNIEN